MNEKDWQTFFELLQKITKGEGSWRDKKDQVEEKAAEHAADGALEEFVSWFDF